MAGMSSSSVAEPSNSVHPVLRIVERARWHEAAKAHVGFGFAERNEPERECVTGCPERAIRTITVYTPDKKVEANFDLCERHGQAASNDRTNARLGLKVEREFSDEKLRGDAEKVRQLEPVITSPHLNWKSVDLVDRSQEPPRREPPQPRYVRDP